MTMVRMRATKALTYNTRRLLPGDVFEVKPRDARVLLATRKVEAVREPANVPPPPPVVAAQIAAAAPPAADNELAGLRAEYETKLGKRPFLGWSAAMLREKIAAAAASS